MTQGQRHAVGSLLGTIKEIVLTGGALMAIAIGCWGVVQWDTGGLRPQTQVASSEQAAKLDSILNEIAALKKAFGDFPHPYEFEDDRRHFLLLDGEVADEKAANSELRGRVGALESSQRFRNP